MHSLHCHDILQIRSNDVCDLTIVKTRTSYFNFCSHIFARFSQFKVTSAVLSACLRGYSYISSLFAVEPAKKVKFFFPGGT